MTRQIGAGWVDHPAVLAFTRAICAESDNDVPRLALADWMTDRAAGEGPVPCGRCGGVGSVRDDGPYMSRHDRVECPTCAGTGTVPHPLAARAEFVRVQCEVAKVVCSWVGAGGPDCDRWVAKGEKGRCHACIGADSLRKRERELWIDGLIAHVKPPSWSELVLHRWEDQPNYTPRGPEAYVRRGFVAAVTCPAEMWLRVADALVWSPGQTVTCPKCNGEGMIEYKNSKGVTDHYLCGACAEGRTGYRRGTGTVPRPCPPTAQPVTHVTLTTLPPAHVPEFNALRAWKRPLEWGGDVRDVVAFEWPWITFDWRT